MDNVVAPVLFEFGSRSGSYFALALFGMIFIALGAVTAVSIRQRYPGVSIWRSVLPGATLAIGPIALIYISSLGGFYEAEVRGNDIRLQYLLMSVETLPAAQIRSVDAEPAFKTRWRLHLRLSTGEEYESATWGRADVISASEQIRGLVAARSK
jgi:hypothetical protein